MGNRSRVAEAGRNHAEGIMAMKKHAMQRRNKPRHACTDIKLALSVSQQAYSIRTVSLPLTVPAQCPVMLLRFTAFARPCTQFASPLGLLQYQPPPSNYSPRRTTMLWTYSYS